MCVQSISAVVECKMVHVGMSEKLFDPQGSTNLDLIWGGMGHFLRTTKARKHSRSYKTFSGAVLTNYLPPQFILLCSVTANTNLRLYFNDDKTHMPAYHFPRFNVEFRSTFRNCQREKQKRQNTLWHLL